MLSLEVEHKGLVAVEEVGEKTIVGIGVEFMEIFEVEMVLHYFSNSSLGDTAILNFMFLRMVNFDWPF